MTSQRHRGFPVAHIMAPVLAIAVAATAAPGFAQDAERPLGTLGNFSLTPSGPQPTATPTPNVSLTPIPPPLSLPSIAPTPAPGATPRRTPTPKSTPESSAAPKPTPMATPDAAETPAPVPRRTENSSPVPGATTISLTPTVPVAAVTRPDAPTAGDVPLWSWLVGAALLGLVGVWLWSRSRCAAPELQQEATARDPVAAAVASPTIVVPAVPRARLALALRPTRAGLNMLSATVDAEVTVTNHGDAPASAVRLKAQLLSATADHDSAVTAFAAEPVLRPAAPAFALAPGEERRLRIVVALPRDAIKPMTAGARAMFIPLVALNAVYDFGEDGPGQTVQAFAVGVERVDSAKLAPLWLDGPPRMHDAVAARPHAVAVAR